MADEIPETTDAPDPTDTSSTEPGGTGPAETQTAESPMETASEADDRDARIAELEKQLAEAEPIIQAHREAEEAGKTELQKATERAAALETEISQLKETAARARVAEKTGLTSEIVAMLRGSTEDELLAAAEKIAGARTSLRTKSRPIVGAGASADGEHEDRTDPAKLAAEIRKRMSTS